jgi:hypothetical protein
LSKSIYQKRRPSTVWVTIARVSIVSSLMGQPLTHKNPQSLISLMFIRLPEVASMSFRFQSSDGPKIG